MNKILDGISIIIPSHNRKIQLQNLVKSILINQYKKTYEIIIIDDGKIYEKKELLKNFKSKKIHYYSQKLSGPATARNYGLKKAKYNIIAFLDDDCIVAKDWMKKTKEFFDNNTNNLVVGVRGETLTHMTSKYMQAHLLYEKYWLHITHKDYNGKKKIWNKFQKIIHKKEEKEFIIDFAPTNNFTIKRQETLPSFNTDFKEAAGEDVVFCDMIRKHGKLIQYNANILVFHDHPFASKEDFKSKFQSYGRHLDIQANILKKIANIIINPVMISLYHRKIRYFKELFLIEYYINFN